MGFDEPVFMGVYTKTSTYGIRQKVRGFNRWHAWGLDDGRFMVQQVNTLGEAQDEPITVDPEEFFKSYRVSVSLSIKQEAVPPNYKRPEPRRKVARTRRDRSVKERGVYNLQHYQVVGAAGAALENEAAGAGAAGNGRDEAQAVVALTEIVAPGGKEGSERQAKPVLAALIAELERGIQTEPARSKAEPEPQNTEGKLRSEFSRALLQLRTSRSTAIKNLHQLVETGEPLHKAHKFLFAEFGTALRRRQLFALACRYHEKARELAPDDEHVLFNLARSLYDSGEVDRARHCLEEALHLAPGFKAGWDFLAFLNYGRTMEK